MSGIMGEDVVCLETSKTDTPPSMKPSKVMVTKVWKREFHIRAFTPEHNRPEQFYQCQWQTKSRVHLAYLIYRWFLAALFLATMLFSICDPGRKNKHSGMRYISKWPIYLTNWGYTMCTVQAVLGAIIVGKRFIEERRKGVTEPAPEMTLLYKFYWVCHTIALVMSIGITFSYWVTVYDPDIHTLDMLNLMVHAFNSVLMVTDMFLVRHPFRLLHCYWPFSFAAIYVVFSVIYYQAGGTDRHERPFVYPLLDWQIPERTIVAAVFGCVFVLAVHCATWVLYLLRKRIHITLYKRPTLVYHEDNKCPETSNSLQMDAIC